MLDTSYGDMRMKEMGGLEDGKVVHEGVVVAGFDGNMTSFVWSRWLCRR